MNDKSLLDELLAEGYTLTFTQTERGFITVRVDGRATFATGSGTSAEAALFQASLWLPEVGE